jgi:serine/threonine protein kinase
MSECPATGDGSTSAAGVPADWPTLPGYEILGELGRGGMGVVYKARQIHLKRLVALKVMRDAALASPQERGRFRIEAEAAARMRHPNIVQIYEVGEHQGRPYFVMELVEGGRLDHYIAGRPQAATLAAELVRALALAIQHAHAQHIIHRDLKPANILLVSGEWSGSGAATTEHAPLATPKITDFGLAKRLDTDSTAWTQDGAILGTASYMAPEQAAGRVGAVGPAVDVYALGAILYELLTGRPPFQAESWNETIQQVLHDEPTLPRRLRPDIPCDLETVCLKCLDKEPGRRYASAEELADDLGRFLEGKPVAAVPLGERERLARLAARDGYQLLAEIGRGPRSTVYHALYEPLQQPVAVKVFSAGACPRDEWEARLRAGANLGAVVAHPQVIPIHRAGWWDGAPYVAVEYIPQGSLAGKLAGRPYPLREALRLAEQLAEVVSYLHRQGVVHGNLKPSNVLLAADGIPRLTDFRPTGGLFQGAPSTDFPESTGLAYLAPELVRDSGGEPRPYTDIYGLGVILYELLTGRPPFAGATAREVLEQVCKREPVPPSRFNREVTPHLAACCLRCLRKDPWRRYYRAYDLLTRLRQFKAAPSSWAVSGERWPKRRRLGEDETPRAPNP